MTIQYIITSVCEYPCILAGLLGRCLLNGIAFRYPTFMGFLSQSVKLQRLCKSKGKHGVSQRDINCQFTATTFIYISTSVGPPCGYRHVTERCVFEESVR